MAPFVPRERKHRKLQRQSRDDNVDTNAVEIGPEQARKTALRASLVPEQSKMSSKKKKRLDKYIDKKMQKEENLDLIKKLATQRVDTGLLRSSKKLGATRLSKRERMSQALNETKAGIITSANREILYQPEKSDESDSLASDTPALPSDGLKHPLQSLGSGLREPIERDAAGNPILAKRKRKAPRDEESWEGCSSDTDAESPDTGTQARSSAFKMWAITQMNEAVGFAPSESMPGVPTNFTPRAPDIEPLPPEVGPLSSTSPRKAHGITIVRGTDIDEARSRLPVVSEEQRIMEAVHNNHCVIVAGETGSGKTTQIPQFLYEAGYGQADGPYAGMIGITQPRRVAAMSMARRVAVELGPDHGLRVGHQIRFDSTVKSSTAIKFMTDGVLLREIAADFILSRYSAIVIDEAHERSTNTDILVGLMSRIVDLRETMSKEEGQVRPLKLIIMSATLRVQDFLDNKNLFRSGPPPLVQIEGRQHPVAIHFSRETQLDYIDQIYRRVCRGHRVLPPGGMLVFLTSQEDILALVERLNVAVGTDDQALSAEDDEDFWGQETESSQDSEAPRILPLYASLSSTEQLRVFEEVPASCRLIVLATNVAETSLTIPGIRYVFDSGRVKEKIYDRNSGVQSFKTVWISKASASQRAGRAGRTGPGHCYRLYSSAVFERDFEAHTLPEITRMPVEDVVLQLKSMDLHNVVNFPFPSPPDRVGLARAEKLLLNLNALFRDGHITPLGRQLALYPVSPRFAKMLSIGHQQNCMRFVLLLVAAMATPNFFLPHVDSSDYNHAQHLMSKHSSISDALKVFTALQTFLKIESREDWCSRMFVSARAAQEAANLFQQLLSIVLKQDPVRLSAATKETSVPSKTQVTALEQIAAAGFLDQIAILATELPSPPYLGRSPQRAIDVPYVPLTPLTKDRTSEIRSLAAYIHPSSLLARRPPEGLPKYVVYSHLQRSQRSQIEGVSVPKTRMHAITGLDDAVLGVLARNTPLLQYGKPLGQIVENVGPQGKTRSCVVGVRLAHEIDSAESWPLPAQHVRQVKDKRGEWTVEAVLS